MEPLFNRIDPLESDLDGGYFCGRVEMQQLLLSLGARVALAPLVNWSARWSSESFGV